MDNDELGWKMEDRIKDGIQVVVRDAISPEHSIEKKKNGGKEGT